MKYGLNESNGTVIVELSGVIDFACNEEFEVLLDTIKARKPTRIVFDLSAVDSLDSVGLGLMYIAREDFEEIHCPFSLRRPSGPAARLLALTNSKMAFVIEDN